MKIEPDMAKVRAAVEAIEARRRARTPDHRTYPPPRSPVAQDVAIRKPLTSHGDPCVGFNYYHFHNRD
jgi:hypothetical protein